MRIVGGSHRGRSLNAPAGRETRPTLDRVREALFNILSHGQRWYEDDFNPLLDGVVLDAFAGSGALGLEALSRGAKQVVFFDMDKTAIDAIEQNVTALRASKQTVIMRVDATRPPHALEAASLVFLDPPYLRDLLVPSITALSNAGWINKKTLLVAERDPHDLALHTEELEILDSRKYGRCQIDIARLS